MKLPSYDAKRTVFEKSGIKQEFDYDDNQDHHFEEPGLDFGGFENTQSKQELFNLTQFPEGLSQMGTGISKFFQN